MTSTPTTPALVVGVGASAGGLEAFKQLMLALPDDTGMAFLLVQHLAADHDSLLADLLAPCTGMDLREAENGVALEPDTVYVIRPDTALGVREGRIEVSRPPQQRGVELAVDHLFRALAREFGHHAAALVLSGAGSDGSAGVRHVRAAGGLTIAQTPTSCRQAGMPESAIATGAVDVVLEIADMPAALRRFERLPPELRAMRDDRDDSRRNQPLSSLDPGEIEQLTAVLGPQTSLDLRAYKPGTVGRRVLRRMALSGFDDLESFLDHLRRDPSERKNVTRDLLISVTDFFRDPDAFEALRDRVIQPLVASAQPGQALRAWVPGCATGEEAYSIAIELLDAIAAQEKALDLQIFATDVDQDAIEFARAALYPSSIVEQIPEDRLQRYFEVVTGRGYRVGAQLRNAVSFSLHDLTRDSPFSRMHLVSCRNLLIYLNAEAQAKVLELLHYALEPDGALFLGSAESAGLQRRRFSTVSKKQRIYRKLGESQPASVSRAQGHPTASGDSPTAETSAESIRKSAGNLARCAILEAFAPPTLAVARDGTIVFAHGDLAPFLRPPQGEDPRFELQAVLRPKIAARTRAALNQCRRTGKVATAMLSPGRDRSPIQIEVRPAPMLGDDATIIGFRPLVSGGEGGPEPEAPSPADETLVEQLEMELEATRTDLRKSVEELESCNEELRSLRHESMSMTEELQSANEELEATTEELRSLNEELSTVNAQLREKVEELEQAHDDLNNFFASTQIATVFLDDELRVKRLTPTARRILDLEDPIGRIVGDLASPLLQHDLESEARGLLENVDVRSREIQTRDGRWFSRQVLPYRTENRRIEGVVITFVDVTELKTTSDRLQLRERQQSMIARIGLRALRETDLQRFMDLVVRDVQKTLDTDYCKVLELQPGGDRLLLRAGVGWKPGLVGSASVDTGADSQAGYTLQTSDPVIVDDLATEKRFSGPPLLASHEVVSGVSCIIRGDGDQPYGVLGAHTRSPRCFGPEDANFLQAAASVVASAINRTQLRKRQALEVGVAQAIADATDLDHGLERVLERMAGVLGASVAEAWWFSNAKRVLVRQQLHVARALARQRVAEHLSEDRFEPGEGMVGQVYRDGTATWWTDLGDATVFVRREGAGALGLVSGFGLPVRAGNEVLGVITLLSAERLFADEIFFRSLELIGRNIGDFVVRSRLEDAQRVAAAHQRLALEAAGMGTFSLDLGSEIVHVDPRARDLCFLDQADIPFPRARERVHPDDRDALTAAIQSATDDVAGGLYDVEYRVVSPEGEIRWLRTVARVLFEDGEPVRRVGVIVDQTAARKARRELSRSEARLSVALEATEVGVWELDIKTGEAERNLRHDQIFGHEELLPTWSYERFIDQVVPEDREDVGRRFREALEQKTMWHFTYRIRRVDGELRWVETHGMPITGPTGEVERVIGTVMDTTERKRIEEGLREADRQKDEFLAMLGHELRNPLAAIRSAAELLRLIGGDEPRLGRTQAILERQSTHMAKLLDGLLDVSRIIRGRVELDRELVDLVALCRDVASDIRERSQQRDLAIRTELPSEPVWIDGDPVRLTQVVDNLLSNALKYTADGGRITLSLRRDHESAVLEVRDTGVGIEPELLPYIFDVFRQAEQSLDRSGGGLGLGLALVRSLVEMHGGAVEARSEGPGRGADFIVRLPSAADAAPAARNAPAPPGPLRILIIEDNEDSAEVLKDLLELSGHQVSLATRARQGIDIARERSPDIVVCDIGLPDGMSGYEVAETLRSDPATRSIGLVALSGYGRPEDRERSQRAGFDAHLTKPADVGTVTEVLDAVCGRAPG